jgi:hypothetical protein
MDAADTFTVRITVGDAPIAENSQYTTIKGQNSQVSASDFNKHLV